MPAVYDSEELADAEAKPQKTPAPAGDEYEYTVGAGYTGGGSNQPSRFSLRGRLTRRRVIFGGGIIATIIFLIITFLANGPLEFIHIAQLMERFHFSHQENAGDDRMGRLYRYMRSGGNAGETRLGYLGSKMTANMLADLEKIGLKPVFTPKNNVYQGFEVDTKNEKSPYRGMNPDEIEQALKDKGINPKEITSDGKTVRVSVKGYAQQRRSLKFLTDEIGNSKIASAVRVRVLSRYGLVTWHPLKKADVALNEKISELYDKWKSNRNKQLATGEEDTVSNTENAKNNTGAKDQNGKPLPPESDPGSTVDSSSKYKDVFNSIKESGSLKVAGHLSIGVGAVCVVYNIYTKIGDVRYLQVIAPLTRVGMEAVTTGNQIMSGQDVSSTEVSFLAKNFGDGNSTWAQAKPILAQQGVSGGIDITQKKSADGSVKPDSNGQSIKESLSGDIPSWIAWAGGAKDLCTGASGIAIGVFGLAINVFSGGLIGTVANTVATGLASQYAVDKLSALLAGDAVNVAAQGAQWGNYIDYGSRLAANSMALLFGGVQLTPAQEAKLNTQENIANQKDFQSKNIAYKLFDPYDQRSVISKLIDGSSSSFTQNVNNFASAIWHFGSIFSSLPKMFASTAHAAPLPYDYGFSADGFSQEDLNNPSVADPYANADAAASILDSPDGQRYIQKAQQCFGVDIQKVAYGGDDNTARWDVVPQNDKPANPYDPNKYPADCAKPSNIDVNNWLKIRFFIFDTGILEGYACYQGDNTSCANDGFSNSTADITPQTNPTATSGDSQQLAQQILANKNIVLAGGYASNDMQAAANGKPGSAGVTTSSAILQLILAAGQSHSVVISAIQSGGTGHCIHNGSPTPKAQCPSDPHYNGDAVDFAAVDGHPLTGRDTYSQQLISIAEGILPKGSGFGQDPKYDSSCGVDVPLAPGFVEFKDSCNHLHVQVPAGTP